MSEYIAYNLALGILETTPQRKQELGRMLSKLLGFHPGPLGPDGGIDGVLFDESDRLVYFQCKLSHLALDTNHAKLLYADILYHRATIAVMLAGKGYKDTFGQRLFGHPHLENVNIHLLTLVDVLAQTDKFQAAVKGLPQLENLSEIDWKQFR